jgi:hypothetical protein
MQKLTLVTLVLILATPGYADELWRIDGGLSLSRFEQQVKSEVGGVAGERLVMESQLGFAAMGTYRVWGPLSLGLYMQYDLGERAAGKFEGFDAEGKTVIGSESGGDFQEFWVGPLLRVQWRTLFFELAYGAFGIRTDDARDDLPDESGKTDSALRTSPTIAWLMTLGGGVPVTDSLQVVLRLEYRVRYYDRRGNGALKDEIVHGTQNFTPFVGVAWTP